MESVFLNGENPLFALKCRKLLHYKCQARFENDFADSAELNQKANQKQSPAENSNVFPE